MKIIIEGPPQSGKTTVSSVVKERYGLCYVSTSEAVRTAVHLGNSAHSSALQQLMDADEAIPDQLLAKIVKEAISRPDCANGYVVDGFPRTKTQATLLRREGVQPDAVVELDMSDRTAQVRFGGRWFHPGSSRMYHTLYNPPKTPMKDDVTGEDLQQKNEDTAESIQQRMFHYRRQISDVRSCFGASLWNTVEADGNVEAVRNNVFYVLDPLYKPPKPHADAPSSTKPDIELAMRSVRVCPPVEDEAREDGAGLGPPGRYQYPYANTPMPSLIDGLVCCCSTRTNFNRLRGEKGHTYSFDWYLSSGQLRGLELPLLAYRTRSASVRARLSTTQEAGQQLVGCRRGPLHLRETKQNKKKRKEKKRKEKKVRETRGDGNDDHQDSIQSEREGEWRLQSCGYPTNNINNKIIIIHNGDFLFHIKRLMLLLLCFQNVRLPCPPSARSDSSGLYHRSLTIASHTEIERRSPTSQRQGTRSTELSLSCSAIFAGAELVLDDHDCLILYQTNHFHSTHRNLGTKGSRQHSIRLRLHYHTPSVQGMLRRSATLRGRVAVMGACGAVGRIVSLLLRCSPHITDLRLVDAAPDDGAKGVAEDLAHIEVLSVDPTRCSSAKPAEAERLIGAEVAPRKVRGYALDDVDAALQDVEVVLSTAGGGRQMGMKNFEKLVKHNTKVAMDVATAVGRHAPPGVWFGVTTSPLNCTIPAMAEALKAGGMYHPERLFGMTSVSTMRARCYYTRETGRCPGPDIVVVGGQTGQTIVPLFSQANNGAEPLPEDLVELLTIRVSEGGASVTQYNQPSSLACAVAARDWVEQALSVLHGVVAEARMTALVESPLFSSCRFFSSPLILSRYEEDLLDRCLPDLEKNIKRGLRFYRMLTEEAEAEPEAKKAEAEQQSRRTQ
eukprot:gene6323-4551_t